MASATRYSTIYTPHIERDVWVREETSDKQVWSDTFTGLYHRPPEDMPEPQSILDLGANIGLTAAHYRYLWPEAHIVAVEMDEANAKLARRNAPGVIVRHQAVARVPGWGFYDPAAAAFAYALGDAGTETSVETLDEIIMREFGGPVDFVKMDVEGEEWDLFTALKWWKPLVRHLVVELHERERAERGTMVTDAIDRLERHGYRARHHLPHPTAVYAWR